MSLRVRGFWSACLILLILVPLSMLLASYIRSSPAARPECCFFKSLGVNSWPQAYESIDQRVNEGHGYANHLDTIGYLSWRQSRVLDSYLNMYEATRDFKWLEKFIYQADLVIVHRDDHMRGGHRPGLH